VDSVVDYYRRRACAEFDRALGASTLEARCVHYALADAYRVRVARLTGERRRDDA